MDGWRAQKTKARGKAELKVTLSANASSLQTRTRGISRSGYSHPHRKYDPSRSFPHANSILCIVGRIRQDNERGVVRVRRRESQVFLDSQVSTEASSILATCRGVREGL
jgi:hypothetical protein